MALPPQLDDVVIEFKNLGIESVYYAWAMTDGRLLHALMISSSRDPSSARFVQSGMMLFARRIVHYFSQSLVHSICEYGPNVRKYGGR
jgi:hypothetical protein